MTEQEERAAFEMWYGPIGWREITPQIAWEGWKARAELATLEKRDVREWPETPVPQASATSLDEEMAELKVSVPVGICGPKCGLIRRDYVCKCVSMETRAHPLVGKPILPIIKGDEEQGAREDFYDALSTAGPPSEAEKALIRINLIIREWLRKGDE